MCIVIHTENITRIFCLRLGCLDVCAAKLDKQFRGANTSLPIDLDNDGKEEWNSCLGATRTQFLVF
jgi:hypothetical protein